MLARLITSTVLVAVSATCVLYFSCLTAKKAQVLVSLPGGEEVCSADIVSTPSERAKLLSSGEEPGSCTLLLFPNSDEQVAFFDTFKTKSQVLTFSKQKMVKATGFVSVHGVVLVSDSSRGFSSQDSLLFSGPLPLTL